MSRRRFYGLGCSAGSAALLALFLLAFGACSRSQIENAFGPGMMPEESGKVITKYCLSCHQHKDFSAPAHYEYLKKKYPAEKGYPTDCRGCHTYEKNWLFDVKRTTHDMKGYGAYPN